MTADKSQGEQLRERPPVDPRVRSRRLAVRLVAALIAFVVIVVVPTYVALRPQFVQRYSNLAPEYRTWSTSTHAEVSCRQCHVRPGVTAQAAFAGRMLGEFYLSVVTRSRQPDIFQQPTNAACEACHVDLRTVSPSGDLKIPHRAHVDVLGVKCVKCHAYLVHEKNPAGNHAPTMATCLTCHDGEQAKNACATCHTRKAAPANHASPDWLIVHAEKQKELDCAKCHAWTKDWCAECHSRRPQSHTDDWRAIHGARVKTHRNCEVCHEAKFCIRCHGELPRLNYNPALKLVR